VLVNDLQERKQVLKSRVLLDLHRVHKLISLYTTQYLAFAMSLSCMPSICKLEAVTRQSEDAACQPLTQHLASQSCVDEVA